MNVRILHFLTHTIITITVIISVRVIVIIIVTAVTILFKPSVSACTNVSILSQESQFTEPSSPMRILFCPTQVRGFSPWLTLDQGPMARRYSLPAAIIFGAFCTDI